VGDAAAASFERYVAGLPGGLAAHPGAQVKGSVVRNLLEEQPPELLARIPVQLQRLVKDPPIDSDWVPETYLGALIHAIGEARGLDERELLGWIRARNRALFSGPIYRMLMMVVSPEAMARHAGRRWGNFHRGTTLELEGYSDDGVRLVLAFPPGVFDRLLLKVYAEAYAAALEAAHAKDPAVLVEASGVGFARYLARW
jgi:hypothetical protein